MEIDSADVPNIVFILVDDQGSSTVEMDRRFDKSRYFPYFCAHANEGEPSKIQLNSH